MQQLISLDCDIKSSLSSESQPTKYVLRRLTFDSLKIKNKPNKVFIESHRGVNKEEPENTLAAFHKAILLECDSIEMDIWLTKDNIPIVLHGTEDGRIHEKSEKINNYNYSEISQIDLAKENKIPKLEHVFQLCKNKIFLNLEIKDINFKLSFQKVYKLILDFNMQNQVAISSFHHDYYQEIKVNNLDSKIEFGFLYDNAEYRKKEIELSSKNSTINLYFKDINEEIFRKAHDSNIGVLAWFKMTDDETEEIIRNLIKCEIDVICTNDPRNLLRILKSLEVGN